MTRLGLGFSNRIIRGGGCSERQMKLKMMENMFGQAWYEYRCYTVFRIDVFFLIYVVNMSNRIANQHAKKKTWMVG